MRVECDSQSVLAGAPAIIKVSSGCLSSRGVEKVISSWKARRHSSESWTSPSWRAACSWLSQDVCTLHSTNVIPTGGSNTVQKQASVPNIPSARFEEISAADTW